MIWNNTISYSNLLLGSNLKQMLENKVIKQCISAYGTWHKQGLCTGPATTEEIRVPHTKYAIRYITYVY